MFVQGGLDILNSTKAPLINRFRISIWGGLELYVGGDKPTKGPHGNGTACDHGFEQQHAFQKLQHVI